MSPVAPPGNIVLSFQGVGFSTGKTQGFEVMVGDNPPTITGGYAKWTAVPRPYQRSLTVPNGYDPVQMTVEVRFGRWGTDGGWWTDQAASPGQNLAFTSGVDDSRNLAGQQVEADIAVLEWMAGSNFQQGPPPYVYVYSHSNQGGDTNLIPPQYANVPWVVNGLQWGKAIRNPDGYRIWQDATITLLHYLNLSAPPPPDTNTNGGYFTSVPGRNTPLLIAGAPSVNSPLVDHRILARRICEDPKNNPCKGTTIRLSGKSLSFPVRSRVQVWVPSHQNV